MFAKKILLPLLIGLAWLGFTGLAGAQTVTLNLKNADISALISTVAEVTGKNFIIDPRVKGKVTVVSSQPMDNEAVYAVFLSILQVHGFAAVPSGAVIKIVPDVNAKQDSIPTVDDPRRHAGDEMVTRVVQVDNVAAAQLVPILRPLVPQQGHLAAYPATNVLIISDRADNVERLVQIIRRIDLVSDAEIELISLQHASAVEVVRILTALNRVRGGAAAAAAGVADQSTLVADERTNSVMLGGDRSDRLRLRAIISHLDTPLERGGNTHVIYLRYAKAAELVKVLTGVSTGIQAEQRGQATQTATSVANIQADENTNAIVLTAPPDVFRSLQAVIRQLDIRRAQVHIDAVIAEITQGKDAQLGVQWRGTNDLSGSGAIGGTSFGRAGPNIGTLSRNPLAVGDGLSVGYFEGTASIFGTEFLNIGVLLQALAADTATNILSTPSLVTLDNQEAEIVVAENVPFVTGSFTSTGTGEGVTNPFQTIQRQDVGLTLRVTPQINEGNAIQLNIEQESSSISEAGSVPGARDITTNKRSIKTTVLVEDRQMVVLGGLIDDSLQESVDKVPLLGDLPLMGNLFKSRSTKKQKRNLMVFIQPAILRDAAVFTETSSGKYNYMRGLQTQAREEGVNLMPGELPPVLPEYPLPPIPPAEDNYKQVDE